jgi:hypothetical protein
MIEKIRSLYCDCGVEIGMDMRDTTTRRHRCNVNEKESTGGTVSTGVSKGKRIGM